MIVYKSFFGSAVLLLSLAGVAGAQEEGVRGAGSAPVSAVASPRLPPGHWAVEAARRAEALGFLEVYLPAQRSVPRLAVGSALLEAARRAEVEGSALAPLAQGWYARFAEEFPETASQLSPDAPSPSIGVESAVGLLFRGHTGFGAPGTGIHWEQVGVAPQLDEAQVGLAGTFAVSLGGKVGILAEPRIHTDGAALHRWEVTTGWRRFSLSVGRQPVGYGYGFDNGVVLSGTAALDRVLVETAHPIVLPSVLAYLGPVSFSTFLSRFSDDRHPYDPYFWGASGSIRPHPRFTFSINRAAFFGGETVPIPVTARNLLTTFVGKHVLGFSDQIVAVEFRFRPPTEPILPLTLYLEWGAEDSAGAWRDVPGIIAGAFVPAVPGLPQLAAGVQYTQFGESCCGNPPWYRHTVFPGGWAAGDFPLGHSLGGSGTESLFFARADLLGARLRVDGRVFIRERGGENLFVPGREGSSAGFGIGANWRVQPAADLGISLSRDAARDWAETRLQANASLFF